MAKKEEGPAKESAAASTTAEETKEDQATSMTEPATESEAAKKEEGPAKESAAATVKSTVSMKPPAGCGAFGFAGKSYAPDEKGIVEIPAEAVGDALIHGYEVIAEK